MIKVNAYVMEQIDAVEEKLKGTTGLDAAMQDLDVRLQEIATTMPKDKAQALYDSWNEVFSQIVKSERAFYRQGLADGQRLPMAMRAELKPEGLPFPDFDRLYGYPKGGYEKYHNN